MFKVFYRRSIYHHWESLTDLFRSQEEAEVVMNELQLDGWHAEVRPA